MSSDNRTSSPIPPGSPVSFTHSELGLGPNGTPLSTPVGTPPSSPEPRTPVSPDRVNPIIRRPPSLDLNRRR